MKKILITFVILSFFQCTSTKRITGVVSENGMVVSAHPIASQIGADIMKQGGNAYDAAVAVQFALAVCYPRAGNIGGGGFMVSRDATGEFSALDFREKAPLAATTDMYLDETNEPIDDLSTQGYLAVGVPGSVAGMAEIHKEKGKLNWEQLVQPAIDLAKNGFELTENEAAKLNDYQHYFYETNKHQVIFLNDEKWETGDILKIPELAKTFERIRDHGKAGFYEGETAKIIAEAMKENGGLITEEDLKQYNAVWRTPLEMNFQDYHVVSMPPASSGGVALIQLLKGVDQNKEHLGKHNSSKTIHLYTELERRVYADRATHLGDMDFYEVPIEKITSDEYLRERNSNIDWAKASKSSDIKEGKVDVIESIETTHFSIVDPHGNAVAITTTLNGNFGSKVYLEHGGFLLNNEMDDFSIKPGVPNMFGLVGAEANKIEPGKRMLSSMTPTILEKNGELFMVVGTPGGSTIITSVFQTIMNVVYFDMTMQEAVNAKKVHHQWLPNQILVEDGALDEETRSKLIDLGHELDDVSAIGRVDAILIRKDGSLEGAADPRGDDKAVGF